jgi:Spy/CpxP family protein refolding chaperone
MKLLRIFAVVVVFFCTTPVFAQTPAFFNKKGSPLTSLQASVSGTFWRNPKWVKMLQLSTDQQTKMDEIFQQHRLKLIDLTASLQKEELILEPLMGMTPPAPEAQSKILTQIDRIADARAELEKANSRMLVSILQLLTPEQWSKLPMGTKKGLYATK